MLISVDQSDINDGIQKNCKLCPVANAIRRITGRKVSVGTSFFRIAKKDNPDYLTENMSSCDRYYLGNEVGEKIEKFDWKGLMEPFSFEVCGLEN